MSPVYLPNNIVAALTKFRLNVVEYSRVIREKEQGYERWEAELRMNGELHNGPELLGSEKY